MRAGRVEKPGISRSYDPFASMRLVWYATVLVVAALASSAPDAAAAEPTKLVTGDRIETIKSLGYVTCGIDSRYPGFARREPKAAFLGFEIDICRAVAASLLGKPDAVRFLETPTIHVFMRDQSIDLVVRRLTVSSEREAAHGVRFGPVVFHDGQGLLAHARTEAGPSDVRVCTRGGSGFDHNLIRYFRANSLALRLSLFDEADAAEQKFVAGECDMLSADVSELISVAHRWKLSRGELRLLDVRLSSEPLAPVVRASDERLLEALRWTVYAIIRAEEIGLQAGEILQLKGDKEQVARARLGIAANAAQKVGLHSDWVSAVLIAVGNYGELYERHFGAESETPLERGRNSLMSAGGLLRSPAVDELTSDN